MSFKKPKAPRAPNPSVLAGQQARFNQINEETPFGSIRFSGEPGSENRLRTTTLSPEARQLADLLSPIANQLASRFGELPDIDTDFEGARGDVEQATTQRALGLLRPELNLREDRLRERLAQSGNPLGTSGQESPGAASELDRFGRQRNELELNAALEGVRAGGAEQSRLFGINQSARNEPLQQLLSILSASPVFGGPKFGPPQGTDLFGPSQLKFQGDLARFNQQSKQQQGLLGGLLGLGSAGIFGIG